MVHRRSSLVLISLSCSLQSPFLQIEKNLDLCVSTQRNAFTFSCCCHFMKQVFLGSYGMLCGSCWRMVVLLNIPQSLRRRGRTSRPRLVKQCASWAWLRCVSVKHAANLRVSNTDTHNINDIHSFWCSHHRNSRLPGVVSLPPCPFMLSSSPTSAVAGPFTCSSSASRRILRKSSASPSARFRPHSFTTSYSTDNDKYPWRQIINHKTDLHGGFLKTGWDPVRCPPHGDDNCSSYWRTAGWLLTQQQNHVHHEREETHELWRYVLVNKKQLSLSW